ncbi:pentatricopeptide repeat-containing protein At4g38010 [Phoenix dactylifera]|uniref:Pentatricopeptide repeat-containing protein At4g38010 n=1 Tax=Phoenix dactylifera TaxID=42345 RepID=A0A8B8JAK4_PHODC|nr:pentatricopeptide repeat-containing protein At4g38010 [Phoenix dactylifera]XP_026664425.2 pentatricopeptide repeat-containing protein At4g38010 [Phoenix dactylifera]
MRVASSAHPLKSPLLSLLHEPVAIKSFNQIHALLLTSGFYKDSLVLAKFAELLALSTHPSSAYKVLRQIHHHPIPFVFNSLISGYARSKAPQSAFLLFKHLVGNGAPIDNHTLPAVLKSCTKFSGIGEARQLHGVAIKVGFLCDLYVQNALVHVYGTCGGYADAGDLFEEMPVRDVVSWTALISAYVKGGFFIRALELFALMDVEPNMATLVCALVACGRLGDVNTGKGIHGLILKHEGEFGVVVGNALLDMYVKCECLDEARRIFEELQERDIVSWTSIISGLVQCKQPKEAIEMFHEMCASGLEPDKVTLSSVLSACASLGLLDSGKWVHDYIERWGIEWDVHIGTAMVDMYAKCGLLEMAMRTFEKMPHRNVSSWNALLGGLAIHGCGKEALQHFDRMVRNGFNPNEVTFVAILSACSHSGLVEEGRHHFKSMTEIYNLTPRVEHYGCLIDLLCRAGLISEAHELVRSMPMKADVLIWGAMLSSCKAHGNVELSQQILGHLLELDPSDSGVFVLLSNIYATSDRWGDVTRVRKLMREKGMKKEPGASVIDVDGKAHEFVVGESNHPKRDEIFLVLYSLAKQVQVDGL